MISAARAIWTQCADETEVSGYGRKPCDINVGQVVRDTEELDVIGCLEQRGYCPIQRACVLRGVLRDATDAFLAELDAYTLADLIRPRRELSSLLLVDQHAAR
jgi:Rrf2 family transcriptional regulator, nitric oxide-sensitive transcriptional repressor